jgi:hypothetical protein
MRLVNPYAIDGGTMRRRKLIHMIVVLLVTSLAALSAQVVRGGFEGTWGPLFTPAAPSLQSRLQLAALPSGDPLERLRHWNTVAIDASGLDHTPPGAGEVRTFGEQLGPGRASRAMAIVHIAIYEAVNAIAGTHESFTGVDHASPGASMEAAIAQAAHDTLVAMFPSQTATMDGYMADDLEDMATAGRVQGRQIGRKAARAVLARVAGDGSDRPEPLVNIEFVTSDQPGKWRQDPISLIPLALGAYWGAVRPLVLQSGSQFRVAPPPALTSVEYAVAYEEAKRLGGDGTHTSTERTAEQTLIGTYWAYDGTPALCAPPRLYNQMIMTIADRMGTTDVVELSRLLALANAAMSDAAISVWESKFYYQFWRPVTAIRESDPGTGPTGLGDGNAATIGDPTFTPLGAPASNLTGPDFTPPFPSYPSGHAGIGAALFETLRLFYDTDAIDFTFVSDELNGTTVDSHGVIRPLIPRTFTSLSQAVEENGQSRIYLGIHWSFDKNAAIAQGRNVADYVFEHAFR